MTRLLLALPLLTACGEGFYIQQQTCDTDFLQWSGGLTQHLLHGKDGGWDYDPDGRIEARNSGGYDFASGDFGWVTEYEPTHWRVTDTVAGFGYAKTDGDLDVRYWGTIVDKLGASVDYEVREERIGCTVNRAVTSPNGRTTHTGTFVDGAYNYTETSSYEGTPWIVTGTLLEDLSYSETVDFTAPGFVYASTLQADGEGFSREDFVETQNNTDYEGYFESFLDGGRHDHYTVDGDAVWDYTTDYSGNGTGTFTDGSDTCTLTFTEGECAYDCGGGDDGSC